MQNGIYVEEDICIWEYLHNKRVTSLLQSFQCSFFITEGLSFGGFALKIEFVVFVYELIIYL